MLDQFNQFKMMGALAGLMRDKDRLKRVTEEFREALEGMRGVGSSGGGTVRVTVTGKLRVVDVHLDPALIADLGAASGGRDMAQALVLDAVNDAIAQVQRKVQEEADARAREMGLPGLPAGGLGGLFS